MSLSFATPFRYPGGKGRLGAWFSQLVKHNKLSQCHFIEPYAGGAGSAIFLLVNNQVDRITINDADPVIYSAWWAIKNDCARFLDLVENARLDVDEWRRQRSILLAQDTSNMTELGFSAFYQNRTNRSGILKGGVIGGLKQNGEYKLDARFNKNTLIRRVEDIAKKADRITVSNLDALNLLARYASDPDNNKLVYLDPPYYRKGKDLYRNFYVPEDHIAVSRAVKELKCSWVVTYDNCEEIKSIYNWTDAHEFSLKYSTYSSRPTGQEVCFTGNIVHNPKIYLKR